MKLYATAHTKRRPAMPPDGEVFHGCSVAGRKITI